MYYDGLAGCHASLFPSNHKRIGISLEIEAGPRAEQCAGWGWWSQCQQTPFSHRHFEDCHPSHFGPPAAPPVAPPFFVVAVRYIVVVHVPPLPPVRVEDPGKPTPEIFVILRCTVNGPKANAGLPPITRHYTNTKEETKVPQEEGLRYRRLSPQALVSERSGFPSRGKRRRCRHQLVGGFRKKEEKAPAARNVP
ncbi:hypothetical protein CSUB01_02383 [Colletotrichum sublineola]|uniref:Uncharacterized protein n=1 Tax=Colletotrichum sublineola TaxID=1173701 RepID=A0A066XT50_COLSU|nr:hypothetical protein CSUB01_02383 [Colletotrichum sublineola]